MLLLPVVADERCAGQMETGRSFPYRSIEIEPFDEEREFKILSSGMSHPLFTRKDCRKETGGGLLERKPLVNTNS